MHTPLTLHQPVTTWLKLLNSNGHTLDLQELLSYRQSRALAPPRRNTQSARGRGGNQLSKFKGRGMEFDEVRHYQSGDDIRAIDWRVTARTGRAHTKLFREEKERPVLFMTDFSPTMQFGSTFLFKSVQAAHITALLAWQAAYRGDRVGGLVFNQHTHTEIKPGSRDKGVLRLLHALVSNQQNAPTEPATGSFSANIKRLRQLLKTGARVYLLSDFHQLTENHIAELRALTQHNAVQAVLISDPLELTLPDVSPTQVQAVDEHFVREFWLGDKRTTQTYTHHAQEWLQQRRTILRQAGIAVAHVSASLPVSLQWQEMYR